MQFAITGIGCLLLILSIKEKNLEESEFIITKNKLNQIIIMKNSFSFLLNNPLILKLFIF